MRWHKRHLFWRFHPQLASLGRSRPGLAPLRERGRDWNDALIRAAFKRKKKEMFDGKEMKTSLLVVGDEEGIGLGPKNARLYIEEMIEIKTRKLKSCEPGSRQLVMGRSLGGDLRRFSVNSTGPHAIELPFLSLNIIHSTPSRYRSISSWICHISAHICSKTTGQRKPTDCSHTGYILVEFLSNQKDDSYNITAVTRINRCSELSILMQVVASSLSLLCFEYVWHKNGAPSCGPSTRFPSPRWISSCSRRRCHSPARVQTTWRGTCKVWSHCGIFGQFCLTNAFGIHLMILGLWVVGLHNDILTNPGV